MVSTRNICIMSAVFIMGVSMCFGADNDIKNIVKDLKSSSKPVVISAINWLALSKNPGAEDALIIKLRNEKDNYIKIKIIEALVVIKSSTALNEVIALTNDPNQYVRQAAVRSLSYFDNEDKTVPALKKVLNSNEDASVKMTAINTLGLYKSSAAAAAIDGISRDKSADKKLRDFGDRALDKKK